MKYQKLLAFVLLTLCAALSGCAVNEFIKTYDGDALPLNQSALLKPTIGVVIKSINGKPVTYIQHPFFE